MADIEITDLPPTTVALNEDYLHSANQSGQQFKVPLSYVNSSVASRYDPSLSGLSATTIQGAIDEIATLGLPSGVSGDLYYTSGAPVTVYVGPTGDFQTLEEALAFYALYKGTDPLNPAPGFGVKKMLYLTSSGDNNSSSNNTVSGTDYLVTILLQDSYVWNTGIILYGGIDLSHIVVKMQDDTKYTSVSPSITSGALLTCTEGSQSPLLMNKVNMGSVSSNVGAYKAVGKGSALELTFADSTQGFLAYGCHVINCEGVCIELQNEAVLYGGCYFTGGTYFKADNSFAYVLYGKSPRCKQIIDASASKICFSWWIELGIGTRNDSLNRGGTCRFIADTATDDLGNLKAEVAVSLKSGSEIVFSEYSNKGMPQYPQSDVSSNPDLRFFFRGFYDGFRLRGASSAVLRCNALGIIISSAASPTRFEAISGLVFSIEEASRVVLWGCYPFGNIAPLVMRQGALATRFAVNLDDDSLFIVTPRATYATQSIPTDSNSSTNISAIPLASGLSTTGTALFEIAPTSAGIISCNGGSRACFEGNATTFAASTVSNKNVAVSSGGVITFSNTVSVTGMNTSQAKNVWTTSGIISDS